MKNHAIHFLFLLSLFFAIGCKDDGNDLPIHKVGSIYCGEKGVGIRYLNYEDGASVAINTMPIVFDSTNNIKLNISNYNYSAQFDRSEAVSIDVHNFFVEIALSEFQDSTWYCKETSMDSLQTSIVHHNSGADFICNGLDSFELETTKYIPIAYELGRVIDDRLPWRSLFGFFVSKSERTEITTDGVHTQTERWIKQNDAWLNTGPHFIAFRWRSPSTGFKYGYALVEMRGYANGLIYEYGYEE